MTNKNKNKNPRSSLAFFPSKSRFGSKAGNLKDRGRWKRASGASERAASLFASRSYPEGQGKGRRRGEEKEEGGKGRPAAREQGKQFASEKRGKKHSRTNPERSQAVRKQQQKERERERASSPRSGARQPPDLPESPPSSVSSSLLRPPPNSPPSSPPPPFQKPKQHKGGWQKPPRTGRFTQRQQ